MGKVLFLYPCGRSWMVLKAPGAFVGALGNLGKIRCQLVLGCDTTYKNNQ